MRARPPGVHRVAVLIQAGIGRGTMAALSRIQEVEREGMPITGVRRGEGTLLACGCKRSESCKPLRHALATS